MGAAAEEWGRSCMEIKTGFRSQGKGLQLFITPASQIFANQLLDCKDVQEQALIRLVASKMKGLNALVLFSP